MTRRVAVRRQGGAAALSRLVPVLVIIGIGLWLYRALLTDVAFRNQEGLNAYVRTHEYLQEFSHGHWIPQVFPDAVRGAGAAFPRFYPPLSYLFSSALAWVTGDAMLGVNLSFLLATVLSALAMYYLVITLTADRLASLAAGLLYLALPYRFVDVFVRGALAESWAFVWYPLILAGTWKALNRRSIPWYLPVVWAALLLTHSVTALYFVVFYGVVVVVVVVRERHWKPPGALVGAAVLGGGLALWFMLPQQLGLDTVRVSDAKLMGADIEAVAAHRVSWHELVGSYHDEWRGYSASTSVPARRFCRPFLCGLNFALGTGQLLTFGLVVVSLVVVWRSRARARAPNSGPHEPRGRRALDATPWLLGVLLVGWLASVAFVVAPRPFLVILPGAFGYIQFPWRLLGLAAFFAAAMLGVVAASRHLSRWIRYVVLLAVVVLVLAVPAIQRSPDILHDQTERAIGPALHGQESDHGFTVQSEYLPNAIDRGPGRHNPLVSPILEAHVDRWLVDLPAIGGDGSVVSWHRRHGDLVANVRVRTRSVIVFPLVYYDFYRVTADGSRDLATFDSAGLLAGRLPAGTRTVRVSERLSAASLLGLAGTAVSALVLVAIVFVGRARRRGRHAEDSIDARPDAGSERDAD